MSKVDQTLYVYTADDETPDCMRCDHVCGIQERCNKCGSEYWWQHYQRTELDGGLEDND